MNNYKYLIFGLKHILKYHSQYFFISSDESVNFPIQKGLDASRSKIKYFRHNDCDHLEQILAQQASEDKKV